MDRAQGLGDLFTDPSILLLLGFLAMMYFLIIRPQNRRNREQREMMAALKEGDEVITSGGMVGIVRKLTEQHALVEVGDKVQVQVRVQRSAITTLLPRGSLQNF